MKLLQFVIYEKNFIAIRRRPFVKPGKILYDF